MFKLITKSDGSGVSSNGNGGNGGNSSNGRGGDGQSKSTDGKMPNFRKSTAAVRAPLAVITSSSGLSFVFLVALMQNAGLSVVVPSLALQLEALGSDLALLGLVAAAAPFVSVVSPTLFGYNLSKEDVKQQRVTIALAPTERWEPMRGVLHMYLEAGDESPPRQLQTMLGRARSLSARYAG